MAISQKDIDYINKMGLKSLNEYEQTLIEYEKKNKADYSDYKEAVAKRRVILEEREVKFAEEKRINEIEEQRIWDSIEMNGRLDLSKLDPFKKTPRAEQSEFVQSEVQRYWLKKSITKKMTGSPIVYCAVVQVNPNVYAPIKDPKNELDSYPVVLVYAKDDKHRYDSAFLLDLAARIFSMRKGNIPLDCKDMMTLIMRDRGFLHYKVGASVAGDVDAWVTVQSIDMPKLPEGYLMDKEIIPYLMSDYDKPRKSGKGSPDFHQIDRKYYQK